MVVAKFVKAPQTDADVQRLNQTFSDLRPDGRLIAHETIELTLKMTRDQPRYRTVLRHWRRRVFEEMGIFLDGRSAEGRGLKALTPDEMIRWTNREVRAVGRKLKRALLVAATPKDEDIVDPHTRAYRARLISGAEQIAAAHERVMREMARSLSPAKQLPRVVQR